MNQWEEINWGPKQVLERLPHRFPFLLIDRVVSVFKTTDGSKSHTGWKVRAIKCVTFNEPFFQGHFPTDPIMPGVLIIESMAQASGLLATHKVHPTGGKWQFYIAGVDGARFRQPVSPGDVLEIECEVLKDRGTLYVFKAQATVRGTVVCEAELMAKMF
jgi:3-hydroxyacyl-[acyl-carrier-protein] dehydratase